MARAVVALVILLALGACGGGDEGGADTTAPAADDSAATKRHDFAALERCVRRRADGTVEAVDAIRGLTSLADDAFLVTGLPSSPAQSAIVAADDDAHALAAALRQLNYGFVDQQGVNVVIAWQRFPEPGDRAVIDPCL